MLKISISPIVLLDKTIVVDNKAFWNVLYTLLLEVFMSFFKLYWKVTKVELNNPIEVYWGKLKVLNTNIGFKLK